MQADLHYPPELPITERRDEIVRAIQDHPVVIVSGATGSGKTTQIPKFCLAAGRGMHGRIGCTQPRRIAAVTVAQRIAEELGQPLGQNVGYKIRFRETLQPTACIKIMTDGILLAEARQDRLLREYDTIIVDEAHERSLNIDFCLGILKNVLQRRRDFKLIITSATIDTQKFSAAFGNAPVIEVSGRLYPVEVRYVTGDDDRKEEETSYVETAVGAVSKLIQESRGGDILVFLPTERDIREAGEMLTGGLGSSATILPLFARLSAAEQGRIFKPSRNRKIILATNVAETSITIPGIRYVVDTGLARISRYSPRTRTTSLPVTPISRSSADQRKGRCGRTANGICIRLFSEADYADRPLYTPPEILRANLADVILRMLALKIGDVAAFPFIDPPAPRSIQDGYDLLMELGAVQEQGNFPENRKVGRFRLTAKGRMMADIPLDPRLAAMLIEAGQKGCLCEMAVIASALSLQDPRERPVDKEAEADQMQARFQDPRSDFFTLLNIWKAYQEQLEAGASTGQIKRFCRRHFLSFRRMREWVDIHEQIRDVLKEHKIGPKESTPWSGEQLSPAAADKLYAAIHQTILSGYLSNIAVKKEKNSYRAGKGREVMIFPGSALYNKGPTWLVAAEIVETSRLFARTVAGISPDWLEAVGGERCRRIYQDPHWERNRGEVVAVEQVSLYGLIIVADRTVSYGPLQPQEAADIFIRSALVEEDLRTVLPFMTHNRRLMEKVRNLEDRIRRRDLLVDPEDLFLFYQNRLPGVYDIRTLKHRVKEKGGDDFLCMTEADLLRKAPDEEELALYPEKVQLGKARFACEYRFKPGKADDGVTVKIPAQVSSQVPPEAMDWLVPGLYQEKISALIKGLPKEYRRDLVPVAETVKVIVQEMPKTGGALKTLLAKFIYERFHVDIPATAWSQVKLPEHLEMRISLTDTTGKVLVSGRDKSILNQAPDLKADTRAIAAAARKWERKGLTAWDFPDLPLEISVTGADGIEIRLFPALEKADACVNLRLFQQESTARKAHTSGVEMLFLLHFSKDLKFLRRNLVLPPEVGSAATAFGGIKPLTTQLFERVCRDLFARNIRTGKEFEDHAAQVKPVILQAGQAVLEQALPVLQAYKETRAAISTLESRRNSPLFSVFAKKMQAELTRLLPENFVQLYSAERLAHMRRYLKALALRSERGAANFDKELAKSREVDGYEARLNELLTDIGPDTSMEKREKLEAFFWLLQEFKVSVFAQELRTAISVSAKRLNESLREIERML